MRAGAPGGLTLTVQRLDHARGLDLPAYQSTGAAGLDLHAAIADDAVITIAPGERSLVPTGLVISLPPQTEGQIRPRSGLAYRHGVTVLNSPGTIDADYRGEVKVLLINLGDEEFSVTRGLRIAQLVVAPVHQVKVSLADRLAPTDRGTGGFGSTG